MGKWQGLNNDCYYFQVLSTLHKFGQSEHRVNHQRPMRRLAEDNDCYSLWRKLKCGLHNSVCRIWPIVWFSHPTHLTFYLLPSVMTSVMCGGSVLWYNRSNYRKMENCEWTDPCAGGGWHSRELPWIINSMHQLSTLHSHYIPIISTIRTFNSCILHLLKISVLHEKYMFESEDWSTEDEAWYWHWTNWPGLLVILR